MRNLVIAVSGLVILLLIVFLFSKYRSNNDLTLPSPVAVGSPKLIQNQQSQATEESKMNQLPFPLLSGDQIKGKKAVIITNKGDITFEFYTDAPIAASNFINLANKGFYNNLTFHRVIKGFMIQGGDPKGDGTGNPGYSFKDELDPNSESYKKGYVQGAVAMANAGPNTNGSQFFIMHQDYPLPHNYTIFGHVISGQDVVDAIANVPVDSNDKPQDPVIMEKVTIE